MNRIPKARLAEIAELVRIELDGGDPQDLEEIEESLRLDVVPGELLLRIISSLMDEVEDAKCSICGYFHD